jgi:hypothetical protein
MRMASVPAENTSKRSLPELAANPHRVRAKLWVQSKSTRSGFDEGPVTTATSENRITKCRPAYPNLRSDPTNLRHDFFSLPGTHVTIVTWVRLDLPGLCWPVLRSRSAQSAATSAQKLPLGVGRRQSGCSLVRSGRFTFTSQSPQQIGTRRVKHVIRIEIQLVDQR